MIEDPATAFEILFVRREFLLEKREEYGADWYRDREIGALEFAICELSEKYPDDAMIGDERAQRATARRRGAKGNQR